MKYLIKMLKDFSKLEKKIIITQLNIHKFDFPNAQEFSMQNYFIIIFLF